LRCFELASDLKVNLHKSSIRGIRIDKLNLKRYAIMLNSNFMNVPFIYLRVLIGGNHARRDICKDMVLKILKRLSL